MKQPKIALIGYGRLIAFAKEIITEQRLAVDVQYIPAVYQHALTLARQLEGQVNVVITGGRNVSILRENLTTPVVGIQLTGFDLLKALLQAKKFTDEVVVLHSQESIPLLDQLEGVLDLKLHQCNFISEEDAVEKLHLFKKKGLEVIVGASFVCTLAEQYGMRSIFIYSRETILEAVERAIQIVLANHHETAKSQQLKAILDFAYSGIVAADKKGDITVFNPGAERILGFKESEALGQSLEAVFPALKLQDLSDKQNPDFNQIVKFRDKQIVTSRVPILVGSNVEGTVVTFQDADTIQHVEQEIRKNLHRKGLVARYSFEDILGESPQIRGAIHQAKKFAETECAVLVLGETGTGKELFAQSIHNGSARRKKPFVAVNCAALPEALLESELFGYEEGAFTGAKKGGKAGLFELAHEGTLLLDEIGDLSLPMQAKLLRVLQEKEILRVGGSKLIPINVRLISATNRDLWEAVRQGAFREDFYYRISVLQLTVPPLRQRREDLPILVNTFMARYGPRIAEESDLVLTALSQILMANDWRGNVRELENVVQRFMVLIEDQDDLDELKVKLRTVIGERKFKATRWSKDEDNLIGFEGKKLNLLKRREIDKILSVLEEVNWSRTEAARKLGISRSTLWRKLKD